MEKRNVLMICNTPFQIFVATWLRMTYFKNDCVDIVISNHMSHVESLVLGIKKSGVFNYLYKVDSRKFSYDVSAMCYLNQIEINIYPFRLLNTYICLNKCYDIICSSNLDRFTQLIHFAIINSRNYLISNREVQFYLYEEGISTYSKLTETFYKNTESKYLKNIFRAKKYIYKNISGAFFFNPECLMWKPDCPIIQMQPVYDNKEFKDKINIIFNYNSIEDQYDKKYIFMEESFYADGYKIDDIKLLSKIAQKVGQENIIVKIHPRNSENRFEKLGYKTNKNTIIPWEVIALNQDFNEKILLTIASASILNPIRLFNKDTKAYSFYKCIENIPDILKGDLWDTTKTFYDKFYPQITVCESMEDFFDRRKNHEWKRTIDKKS